MKMIKSANNAINSDSKKRRSFVASLFAAGYGKRWAAQNSERSTTGKRGLKHNVFRPDSRAGLP
jgi:hypothetical protein